MRDTVPDRKKHDLHIRLATNRVQTGFILGTFFGSVRSGRDTVPWGGRSVGAVLKGFEDFFRSVFESGSWPFACGDRVFPGPNRYGALLLATKVAINLSINSNSSLNSPPQTRAHPPHLPGGEEGGRGSAGVV